MTEVGNLKQKLDDIDNLLVDAVESYHTPSRFFTYSSAAMQAIRTFTLAVQSNKSDIPNFDTWYEQWPVSPLGGSARGSLAERTAAYSARRT